MSRPVVTRRSQLVLRFIDAEDGMVRFADSYDEDNAEVTELFWPYSRWQGMGEPMVLTVTVNPGDTLNGRDRD